MTPLLLRFEFRILPDLEYQGLSLVGLKQISSPNVAQSRFVSGKDINILR